MLAFKLLLGYYPLRCSESALEKSYREGNFDELVFLAPEQVDDLGNPELLSILAWLLVKMLSSQEKIRPLPVWIFLILRKLQTIQKF
jgi:hypothetical protein